MQKDNSFLFVSSLQCDAVSVLEKEHDYRDEHFDFIQSHLRRFCLQCILGARCGGPEAQASLSVCYSRLPPKRGIFTVLPESRTVYVFLLVLYFTVLAFQTY